MIEKKDYNGKHQYYDLEVSDVLAVWTTEVPRKGQTQTGYGKAIPTQYVIKTRDGRTHRVKCSIFGNLGTLYISTQGQPFVVCENALQRTVKGDKP